MIEGKIVGTPKQIDSVVNALKKFYLENYSGKVNIDLPDAAMYGSGTYIAAFAINDSFIDCKVFDNLFLPGIELRFESGKRYLKSAKSKKGYWVNGVEEKLQRQIVETTDKYRTELIDEENDELRDFEDLEMWELRTRGDAID